MEPFTIIRRTLLGLVFTALSAATFLLHGHLPDVVSLIRRAVTGIAGAGILLLLPLAALGNELGATSSQSVSGIVIHDATETLRRYCVAESDGTLWLVLPGGTRFQLVTSITDPLIVNPGDGSFHTFDVSEVRSALAGVRYPLESISAEVFVLPYPRRSGLESAAGPHVILLSPGVMPLSAEQQHAELVHELGHVVQYARMSDGNVAEWDRYRRLRGIVDPVVYCATSSHADRPHEIFAEDFRALFGDALANYSHSVENSTIEPPASVAGLAEFIRDLNGGLTGVRLAAMPNPSRGPLSFSRPGSVAAPLDLFDAAGRRIATLTPATAGGAVCWTWDGRDGSGHPLVGALFARVRDASHETTRVTLLP